MIPNKRIEAMKKSRIPAKAADAGMANLGKYTFVRRLELPMRLFPESDNAPEKYVQGTNAAYEKTGYGAPSLGILANFPKKIVKTTIAENG
jgi:hypothetical protein